MSNEIRDQIGGFFATSFTRGYKGDSASLAENFGEGRYLGVPILEWRQMTDYNSRDPKRAGTYPVMKKWLCD